MRNILNLFITVLLLTSALFSCSSNPTNLAERYAEVYNSHDVSKIVSLYADDAVFEVVDQFVLNNKDQIREITEFDSVLNILMTLSNFKTDGDTVFCDLAETNEWIKTAGIGMANYSGIFIFENGLIKYLKGEAIPETKLAFDQVLSSFIPWVNENKSEIMMEMTSEGIFIYNAENAKKFLSLLKTWIETKE